MTPAHLVHPELIENVLKHFVVVDHIVFVLGVEVDLRNPSISQFQYGAYCCCQTMSTDIPSSLGQCWGTERPATGKPRPHLQSAKAQLGKQSAHCPRDEDLRVDGSAGTKLRASLPCMPIGHDYNSPLLP